MKKQKPIRKVVIEVNGGVVQEVYSNDPAITVVLVDWDSIRDGGKSAAVLHIAPFIPALPDDTRREVEKTLGKNWIK
jgi:hypothetical protein